MRDAGTGAGSGPFEPGWLVASDPLFHDIEYALAIRLSSFRFPSERDSADSVQAGGLVERGELEGVRSFQESQGLDQNGAWDDPDTQGALTTALTDAGWLVV